MVTRRNPSGSEKTKQKGMYTLQEKIEALNFVRVARVEDNAKGFIYLHNWPTGWQELAFNSKEEANAWILKRNTPA